MTGLQLRNAMQENQSGQLSIQQKQLDLDTQRKTQQAGEAIHQALIETGGDIEKALPKIAQISPELYPHYKKIVDDEKQQGIQNAITARTAQIQNVKDLSGQPAQEITTAAPVATPSTYPGQVGAFNANTPEGPKQIEAPLPEQEISGIPQLGVPATKIRPESQQSQFRKAKAAAEAKLQDQITLEREKQKAEKEFSTTAPPKPSFEELTYEDWVKSDDAKKYPKNRIGFDRYKQEQRVEIAAAGKATAAAVNGSDPKETAKGIAAGLIPPNVSSTVSQKDRTAVSAELSRMGINLSEMQRDWSAVQKHLATLNGTQQERLRQAITSGSDMLDKIENLYAEWKQVGKPSGFKLINNAKLGLSKNFPGKAGAVAAALEAQIADFTADAGNVYMGGNSPTDHALSLAAKNLSGDWNEETFTKLLGQARSNFAIRKNSILTSEPVGVTPGSTYLPNNGASSASGGKVIKFDAQGNRIQ